MARDPTKLTKIDARTFAALADGPLTTRWVAVAIERHDITALRSLHRLVLHGLATAEPGERKGFAKGSPAFQWTRVPGAVFPGVAPRKKYALQLVGQEDDDAPPVRIRRTGNAPADVAQSVGLAGLVQQMVGKP